MPVSENNLLCIDADRTDMHVYIYIADAQEVQCYLLHLLSISGWRNKHPRLAVPENVAIDVEAQGCQTSLAINLRIFYRRQHVL